MITVILVCIIAVIALIRWTMFGDSTHKRLPPAPRGRLPIIGHLWQLHRTQPFKTIDRWSKQYGDIFTMYFGRERVVVISRNRLMKKAFLRQSDTFSGRPTLYVHESCWGRGQVISDGASNTETRRFLMTVLRQNGVNRIDRLIADETRNMIESIDRKIAIADNNKCIMNIEDTVLFVVGNVLTQLVLGRSYPHDSDEFRSNSAWLEQTVELMHKTSALTFFPWLRFVPPSGFGYWQMKRKAAEVIQSMHADINKRINSGEYKDISKIDVTSAFLRRIDAVNEETTKDEAEKTLNRECFTRDKLAHIMTELFFAGIKTECSTFGWAFLYFIEHTEIQDQCRQHILDQIGPHRLVTWNDREQLPYLEAAICEIQRCANIAPFSVFHRTTRDAHLDGYHIPRNTTILMNLWTTLRDPAQFSDPDQFNPKRFLDENGTCRAHTDGLYPYGLGSRICMGESLARHELFVVIGALLQRYRFSKLAGRVYSLEQRLELTIHADKYELLVEKL